MTSYLDDTWLQAEVERFEETKNKLQAAAALLERATTATPQLQRSLEQLEQRERRTKKAMEQLSSDQKQELSLLLTQGQQAFDAHVEETLRKLDELGDAGQALQLRQDVMGLLRNLPVLEQQAARLTEELGELSERAAAQTTSLEQQVREIQGALDTLGKQLSAAVASQAASLEQLGQLALREKTLDANLSVLREQATELQKSQQQFQSYQQSQGSTIQRTVQQLSELENRGELRHKELEKNLSGVREQVTALVERATQLEARQTAADSRLEQLEVRLSQQLAAAQTQLQEQLLARLTQWQTESQEKHQQLQRHVESLMPLPQQVTALDTGVRALQEQFKGQQEAVNTRHAAQQEVLADLERQVKTGQTRVARFIGWFEKAGAWGRINGKPE